MPYSRRETKKFTEHRGDASPPNDGDFDRPPQQRDVYIDTNNMRVWFYDSQWKEWVGLDKDAGLEVGEQWFYLAPLKSCFAWRTRSRWSQENDRLRVPVSEFIQRILQWEHSRGEKGMQKLEKRRIHYVEVFVFFFPSEKLLLICL